MTHPLLNIHKLRIAFRTHTKQTDALKGISLHINSDERVALVGESGSGKSVTARAVLGLLQQQRGIEIGGRIEFEGQDVALLKDSERRQMRGTKISMIFQDPVSSLNPVFRIETEFLEVLRRTNPKVTLPAAREQAEEMLRKVSIDDPHRVLRSFPFQLSGGMNQRVMIALALINAPSLLIADEPGTALDVTVQDQTLRLMRRLVEDHRAAVLLISHNLGVVREFSDRIYVIYRGRIVEEGPTGAVFADPIHPYTRALLAAVPRITKSGIPKLVDDISQFTEPCEIHPARA